MEGALCYKVKVIQCFLQIIRKKEIDMIMDLVEDAVEIKLHFEIFTGILQSDYEFAYGLGKMNKILGLPQGETLTEENLEARGSEIIEKLEHYETKDYIEENLVRLLKLYRIQSQKGEEIGELYRRGYEKE